MKDRDFKLLVREYFQAKAMEMYANAHNLETTVQRKQNLEKKIFTELERFTAKEQNELPFKD